MQTNKKVLLIETNGCHGEVISAYVQYFINLNYDVDCLVNKIIKKTKPFCRLNFKKIFSCNFFKFKNILQYKTLQKYDHIFVMSSINYADNKTTSVRDLYPDLNKHSSVFYVHHNTPYISQYFYDIDKKHNITLGKFKNCTFINPHLFGYFKTPKKDKQITYFVSVGGINPNRKNHQMLLDAIETLDKKGLTFKVLIIGSGHLKHINRNCKKHIQMLGHLKYDKMYKIVEKSHFFLPLLDANNQEHDCYISTQVTGSAQLIYGFNKIPVIHKKFANFYGFNSKNSIIYENDLAKGMQKAILSTESYYTKLVKNMTITSNNIKKLSQRNLKSILNV